MLSVKPTLTEMLSIAKQLADRFAERAAQHDREGTFPYENYEDIRASGYPLITVPEASGGWGASMLEAVLAQEQLGMGDGSTALSIAMHVQTVGAARSGERWSPELFAALCRDIVEHGMLINSCATEPEMGSPSHGGRPATVARRNAEGWIINGQKSFASMSPVLDYFIIPAAIEGEEQVGRFLVPRQSGIRIEETWDTMGMRSTGSNDIVLTDVFVPAVNLIATSPVGVADPNKAVQNAWFATTVSAVYLGVAAAAQNVAIQFAHNRVPTALGKPIATLESIQRRLGECELKLEMARNVLYRTAEQWDANPDQRGNMGEAMMVAKLTVTNAALNIVDDAMRVVGGASITHTLPLERYYRDVRAGLYHPPADDGALPLLGRLALQRYKPL
jgi:alkylation response protein AidB-like acyl-CoA dehydrogenase